MVLNVVVCTNEMQLMQERTEECNARSRVDDDDGRGVIMKTVRGLNPTGIATEDAREKKRRGEQI